MDQDPKHIAGEPTGARRLGAVAAALVGLWTALAAYAAHGALPKNPIHLPFEAEINTQLWFPQGWKFFTRDAREEDSFPMVRGEDGAFRRASAAPNFQARHVFGWSRDGRTQGIELGLLRHAAADVEPSACKGSIEACLEQAEVHVTARNEAPNPTLCGDVGIVYQRPVPWAWARSGQVSMRSRVIRMRVTC
jgi:antimicrobial peptide system SdpA family protein